MKIIILIVLFMIALIGYMIYLAHKDKLTYQTIISDKLPSNSSSVHIFFISDIHFRRIRKSTIDKITNEIDLIIVGGDLLERFVPLGRIEDNLRLLANFKQPIYFVWGNNDIEIETQQLLSLFQKYNINVLQDEHQIFEKENVSLNLLGLDYYPNNGLSHRLNFKYINDAFTILIAHKPSNFELLTVGEQKRVDLLLAGHTHGGQIRIFSYGFYTRGGLFKNGKTNIFISEGYGYTFLPFRLGTNAQCHVIRITGK